MNHITGKPPGQINTGSKPFGDQMIGGYLAAGNGYQGPGAGKEIVFDYNIGALTPGNQEVFTQMPGEILENSPMSWWNFALEVHTGRIFKVLIGDFYILIIPLMGIIGTILIISGLVVWIKLYVRKNR